MLKKFKKKKKKTKWKWNRLELTKDKCWNEEMSELDNFWVGREFTIIFSSFSEKERSQVLILQSGLEGLGLLLHLDS